MDDMMSISNCQGNFLTTLTKQSGILNIEYRGGKPVQNSTQIPHFEQINENFTNHL